jgi:hypothetical protein
MSTEFFKKYQALLSESTDQVQVTFVNSGYGITGKEQPQMVQKLGMDLDGHGRPLMYVKSPDSGNKLVAQYDARENRWVVDLD